SLSGDRYCCRAAGGRGGAAIDSQARRTRRLLLFFCFFSVSRSDLSWQVTVVCVGASVLAVSASLRRLLPRELGGMFAESFDLSVLGASVVIDRRPRIVLKVCGRQAVFVFYLQGKAACVVQPKLKKESQGETWLTAVLVDFQDILVFALFF
ncbi:unnamed protein product, partial [Ectocarpus sp. 8 AP-2014]